MFGGTNSRIEFAGLSTEYFAEKGEVENLESKSFLQVYISVLNSKPTEDSLVRPSETLILLHSFTFFFQKVMGQASFNLLCSWSYHHLIHGWPSNGDHMGIHKFLLPKVLLLSQRSHRHKLANKMITTIMKDLWFCRWVLRDGNRAMVAFGFATHGNSI